MASAYRTCLELASERGARTISFPAISTGIFGYPLELATAVAVRTVRDLDAGGLELVPFVCFDAATLANYFRTLDFSLGARQVDSKIHVRCAEQQHVRAACHELLEEPEARGVVFNVEQPGALEGRCRFVERRLCRNMDRRRRCESLRFA